MTENPFEEYVVRLGENRLNGYATRILDFLELLEAETSDLLISFVEDMAAIDAVIVRMYQRRGSAERAIKDTRFRFEDAL